MNPMESIPLPDLAAIIGATVGPMLLFATAIMRYMHVDSTKTRDLIERISKETRDLIERTSKENRDLVERTSKENRDLIEQARTENREDNRESRDLIERVRTENREGNRETRDLIEKNRDLIVDARERLAGIEGHMGTRPPPEDETQPGDSKAA